MKNIVVCLLLFYSILSSETVEKREKFVSNVLDMIQKEDRVSAAFEQYLLDTYTLPRNLNDLKTNKYLGEDFTFDTKDYEHFYFAKNIVFFSGIIRNSIKSGSYKGSIKKLYENNSLRNRTLHMKGGFSRVQMFFKDEFASFLYHILKTTPYPSGARITLSCTNPNANPCVCVSGNCFGASPNKWGMKNHIYFFTSANSRTKKNILYYYDIDNFQDGSMIVNSSLLEDTQMKKYDKYIKTGTTLFDNDGKRYIKTPDKIEKLGGE